MDGPVTRHLQEHLSALVGGKIIGITNTLSDTPVFGLEVQTKDGRVVVWALSAPGEYKSPGWFEIEDDSRDP